MTQIPIIYEDDYLLAVDKPAGVIVHEGAGHSSEARNSNIETRNTDEILLTDWIVRERPAIVEAFADEKDMYFRPGIVHRLDKDTSGLLLIAKTPEVKNQLQALFKNREVTKEYTTLVLGNPEPKEGSIETLIARDPHHRRQMAVSFVGKGKEAKTEYRVANQYQYAYKGQKLWLSLIDIALHSGRMHQIRVHMKHKGWPVIGDQTYQTKPSRNISKVLGLTRQFLHAKHLAFTHPVTHETIDITDTIPDELEKILENIKG